MLYGFNSLHTTGARLNGLLAAYRRLLYVVSSMLSVRSTLNNSARKDGNAAAAAAAPRVNANDPPTFLAEDAAAMAAVMAPGKDRERSPTVCRECRSRPSRAQLSQAVQHCAEGFGLRAVCSGSQLVGGREPRSRNAKRTYHPSTSGHQVHGYPGGCMPKELPCPHALAAHYAHYSTTRIRRDPVQTCACVPVALDPRKSKTIARAQACSRRHLATFHLCWLPCSPFSWHLRARLPTCGK